MQARWSGRDQLLAYMREHIGEWLDNQTLRLVSGLDDVPRTIRLLRQSGWDIEVDGIGHNRLNSATPGAPRGTRESISQKTRYFVLQRGQFRCRACGTGPEDGVKLVVDHIVPVDWGGKNDFENLQALCTDCNQGKQAWVADLPPETMREVFQESTVERRIEALFDQLAGQDVPSLLIQPASGNALDWQRALRRIRQRTGKRIAPLPNRRGYRYVP